MVIETKSIKEPGVVTNIKALESANKISVINLNDDDDIKNNRNPSNSIVKHVVEKKLSVGSTDDIHYRSK